MSCPGTKRGVNVGGDWLGPGISGVLRLGR